MNLQWKIQSDTISSDTALMSREQALADRGYSRSFILHVNRFSSDLLHSIADEVFALITENCSRTDSPAALFIGGQPGSGKSVLSRRLRKEPPYQNFVDVCIDNYRTFHPFYREIEEEIRHFWEGKSPSENESPGNDIADFTHRFSGDLSDLMIDRLCTPVQDLYYNICMDWGMRIPDLPLNCMSLLRQKGYLNEVIFLCVPASVSLDGCRIRADFMNSTGRIFRRIPESFHTLCTDTIPSSCKKIYEQGVRDHDWIDAFSLRDRRNQVLWEIGCKEDPEAICRRILLSHPELPPENALSEAEETWRIEAAGLFRS